MNWKILIRSTGIAAAMLLAGCSGTHPAATSILPGQQAPTSSTIAPPVEVFRADGTSVTLVYATIAALPSQLLTISGKPEHGPTVPDLLGAAGVSGARSLGTLGRPHGAAVR